VVQRSPVPVNPSASNPQEPETPDSMGRKFEIVSVRWPESGRNLNMMIRTLGIAMALGALFCTAPASAQSDAPQNTVRLDFSAYSLSNNLGELRYLSEETNKN
jgi:hypothetical protein